MTHSACLKLARYLGVVGVITFPLSFLAAALLYFGYEVNFWICVTALAVGINDGVLWLWMSAVLSALCRSELDKPSETPKDGDVYRHRSRTLYSAEPSADE
jgi:hypothetical protein